MEWDRADELVFLSKSLGTAVAASYAGDHGLRARHVYYTPVAETFPFMEKASGIAFHGTGDPWVETEVVRQGCRGEDGPLAYHGGCESFSRDRRCEGGLEEHAEIMEKNV